jgi:hypothetical protein
MPDNTSPSADSENSSMETAIDLFSITHAMADYLLSDDDVMRGFCQLCAGPDVIVTDENVTTTRESIDAAHDLIVVLASRAMAELFQERLLSDLDPADRSPLIFPL